MKKILFAASECVPFIKTGGLADVCGALPKTFDHKDWDVRVVIPNYSCIPVQNRAVGRSGRASSRRAASTPEEKL